MYEEIQYGSLYKKNSLNVFLEDGAPVLLTFSRNRIPNTLFAYYVIGIGSIVLNNSDISEDGTEKSRKFFLQYNSVERDTITTAFKAQKTKCGSIFSYLKVYYHNKLIGSFFNTVVGDITITKP